MAGLPWYPRFTGDYSRKTSQLTMLEHGAYTLLLDHYYATGKPLLSSNANSNAELMPDHSRLYRLCGAITKQEQDAVDHVLKHFFEWDQEAGYRNKKADETIEKQTASHQRRVSAGRRGGQSKASSNAKSKARAKPKQPEPEPDINPPTPQGGFRSFNPSDFGGGVFRTESLINDRAIQRAKAEAPGWDIYHLMRVYDEGINSGARERPKSVDAAFPAWCAKYTKGKKP